MSASDFSDTTDFEWALDLLAPLDPSPVWEGRAVYLRLVELVGAVNDAARASLKALPPVELPEAPVKPVIRVGDKRLDFIFEDGRWIARVSCVGKGGRRPKRLGELLAVKPQSVELVGWTAQVARGFIARQLEADSEGWIG